MDMHKIQNIRKWFVIWSMVLIVLSSCEPEFTHETLRPFVEIESKDLSVLGDKIHLENYWTDVSYECYVEGEIFASKEFQWSSPGDPAYLIVQIYVTDSRDYAKRYFNISKAYLAGVYGKNADDYLDGEPVAGEESYNQGHAFIRDNVFVQISTSKQFVEFIPEIARDVDAKLLKSGSFYSLKDVKPTITKFELDEDPIPMDSVVRFSLEAIEPNDRAIIYGAFFENIFIDGIDFKDGGVYFDSKEAAPPAEKIGLTMFAISEFGFCADSTIYFQVK